MLLEHDLKLLLNFLDESIELVDQTFDLFLEHLVLLQEARFSA